MRKLLLALTLSLLSCSAAMACEDDSDCDFEDDFGLNIFFNIGYNSLDLNNLNKTFEADGYRPFGQDQLKMGGSLQLFFGNIMTEFEGSGIMNQPVLNDKYVTKMSAGHALFNLGYAIQPIDELRIYPFVGLGMGMIDIQFNQRNLVLSFSEFLNDPGRQAKLSTALFLLNTGLGINYTLPGDFPLTLGLKGGYLWTPFESNWWQLHDTLDKDATQERGAANVSDGPGVKLNGPYLNLAIGF